MVPAEGVRRQEQKPEQVQMRERQSPLWGRGEQLAEVSAGLNSHPPDWAREWRGLSGDH